MSICFFREKLIKLQIELMSRTGLDPLAGTGFESNPVYCPKLEVAVKAEVVPATPPKLKPRNKHRGIKGASSSLGSPSSFQSHVVESWESLSPSANRNNNGGDEKPIGEKKASFHSHLMD